INRQLIATRKTVGQKKVEVMKERVLEINPKVKVKAHETFYGAENADEFDLSVYDYIVDAIDTVSSKLVLIERAKEKNVPIISCMGAGNKLDPTRLEITDISKTSMCPLAKVMRTELRRRGINHLKVVYSKEPPLTPIEDEDNSCKNHCICPPDTKRKCTIRRQVPGSIAFVPSVAGLILAGEVIKNLVFQNKE
ncbi:MAG: tRNA threonylcarbamoyladenosine dehydratase, partial [Bacillota bacterium]